MPRRLRRGNRLSGSPEGFLWLRAGLMPRLQSRRAQRRSCEATESQAAVYFAGIPTCPCESGNQMRSRAKRSVPASRTTRGVAASRAPRQGKWHKGIGERVPGKRYAKQEDCRKSGYSRSRPILVLKSTMVSTGGCGNRPTTVSVYFIFEPCILYTKRSNSLRRCAAT